MRKYREPLSDDENESTEERIFELEMETSLQSEPASREIETAAAKQNLEVEGKNLRTPTSFFTSNLN